MANELINYALNGTFFESTNFSFEDNARRFNYKTTD